MFKEFTLDFTQLITLNKKNFALCALNCFPQHSYLEAQKGAYELVRFFSKFAIEFLLFWVWETSLPVQGIDN
jgi:hypothetical protein